MKARLQQLQARLDGMTVRERALLLLVVGAVLYMLWQLFLLDPLLAERKSLRDRQAALGREIPAIEGRIAETIRRHQQDPNAPLRQRLAALKERLDKVERQIAEEITDLIAPHQMSRALEDLLTRNDGLKLHRVENRPARPLIPAPEGDNKEVEGQAGAAAGVYRHGLELIFQGDYRQTVAYLEAVEDLEWGLYWDALDLQLEEYPRVRIALEVHTLSLEEGWLGVGRGGEHEGR